jgi:Flp pilus assembly protein TadG
MHRKRRNNNQRGAMSLEFLLVITALMLVFLLMLQYAVKAHAQKIATAAAEEAAAAAAAYNGTAADGETVGNQYLDDLNPGLSHAKVAVTRTGTTATASITGDVEQLFPLLPVHLTVHVEQPVEHFVESTP